MKYRVQTVHDGKYAFLITVSRPADIPVTIFISDYIYPEIGQAMAAGDDYVLGLIGRPFVKYEKA
jgi:hypothetical protein